MKLYIISCNDDLIVNKFITIVRNNIVNIKYIDYDEFKINLIEKMTGTIYYRNSRMMNYVNAIYNLTSKSMNLTFNKLIDRIDSISTEHSKVFIKCNDIHIINLLKAHYKRPNYITIHIDNVIDIIDNPKNHNHIYNTSVSKKRILLKDIKKLSDYKYDHVISYSNSKLFTIQIKRFIINTLGIHFIKLK